MTIKWDTLRTAENKLAEYIKTKQSWLNTERDRLIAGGVVWNGNTYQTDARSVADLMGAVQVAQLASAAGQDFETKWLTMDNIVVTLDLTDLALLGTVVAQHKAQLIYKCREHKDALLLLESTTEVDNYISNLL